MMSFSFSSNSPMPMPRPVFAVFSPPNVMFSPRQGFMPLSTPALGTLANYHVSLTRTKTARCLYATGSPPTAMARKIQVTMSSRTYADPTSANCHLNHSPWCLQFPPVTLTRKKANARERLPTPSKFLHDASIMCLTFTYREELS